MKAIFFKNILFLSTFLLSAYSQAETLKCHLDVKSTPVSPIVYKFNGVGPEVIIPEGDSELSYVKLDYSVNSQPATLWVYFNLKNKNSKIESSIYLNTSNFKELAELIVVPECQIYHGPYVFVHFSASGLATKANPFALSSGAATLPELVSTSNKLDKILSESCVSGDVRVAYDDLLLSNVFIHKDSLKINEVANSLNFKVDVNSKCLHYYEDEYCDEYEIIKNGKEIKLNQCSF